MDSWILQLLGAALAATPGIVALIMSRQKLREEGAKLRAEATNILGDAAIQLVEPLQKRVTALEARVACLEAENDSLRTKVHQFEEQVREFRALIRALWEGAMMLTRQLKDRKIAPAWELTRYRELVEQALGENVE